MEHLSDHEMFLLGKKQRRLKFCTDRLVEAKKDAEVGMRDDVAKWEENVYKAKKDLDNFVAAKGLILKEEEEGPAASLSEGSVLVIDVSDEDVEMSERKIKAIFLTFRYYL